MAGVVGWLMAACLAATGLGVAEAQVPQNPAAVLDLETAVDEALRRGPSLRLAGDAVALAELRREIAASAFRLNVTPTLGVVAGQDGRAHRQFGLALNQRFTFGADIAVSADLQQGRSDVFGRATGYRATVSQSLLHAFGPARTAPLTSATRGVTSASRQADLTTQRVILTVARTFYAVVGQQRLVEAGRQALRRAEILRASSEARTKVGLATQLDVLRAELLIAQAEAQLASQLELLAEQMDQLKILTGRPLNDVVTVFWAPTSAEVARVTAPVEALIPVAIRTRLDLVEARDRVEDATRSASVARWSLVPDVGLTASYAEQRFPAAPVAAGGAASEAFGGWQVGVVTTYKFDRGGRASVAAANIATQASMRAVVELEQQVEAEVRRAPRAAGRAEATIAIQSRAVDLARRQLRLAELRYERGLAGNFDVIDAETSVFQAESALIAAEGARELAALELELAVGTLSPTSLRGGGA